MRKIFRELVTVEEAIDIFLKHYDPRPQRIEHIDLFNALGRVLAEPITANIDVPPFDRSSVDGYAVVAEDTYRASETSPVRLEIIGRIRTGHISSIKITKGLATEVDTGAVIPIGANAVVPVEYTEEKEGYVLIYKRVAPGDNIQYAGSDIIKGETLLRTGYQLTPRDIGVLAALGYREVPVYGKPKVAIFSIGDELVSPGDKISPGKIYDVNSYTLYSSVKEIGGEPVYLGIAKDNPKSIENKIREGLKIADIVISSGSSSAGYSDMVYKIVNKLGEPGVLVHGIKSKPGKPVLISVINNKPYFGLPGFPTSALTAFMVFVAPIIMEMAGLNPREKVSKLQIILKERIRGEKGRRLFKTVSLKRKDSTITGVPLPVLSGAITTLAYAEAFFEVHEKIEFIPKGEKVSGTLFEQKLKTPDLVVAAPPSVILDKKLNELASARRNFRIKYLKMNPISAVEKLIKREVDLAGINIIDENTGIYNKHIYDKYSNIVKVWAFERDIVIVVREGNPHQIKSIEDAINKKLVIANREKGCNERAYFNHIIKRIAERKGMSLTELAKHIPGYYTEYRTISAAILAVIYGKADYCIAPVDIARNYSVNWISLGREIYDIVALKEEIPNINF